MKITLNTVLGQIKAHHESACQSALAMCQSVLKCGDGLLALKQMVAHGEFERTLEGIGLSGRTARRYMQVAEARASDPAKMNYLLNNGASLVDVMREFGLVKPLPQAGYDADKYEQRKALAQLEMAFSYEQSLEAVRAIHKAKLSELSERSLKVLLRDTEEARARLETEISSRNGRTIDLGASPTIPIPTLTPDSMP